MIGDFTPSRAPFTGRKMLITILAFFGVIIAVNVTMLTLALDSFGGLVVKNSYVASQRFNEDVAAAKVQPIRQWQVDAAATREQVSISLKTKAGDPVIGKRLQAVAARPTHERDTVALALTEKSPGVYAGMLALKPGRWIVTLTTGDGQTRTLDLFVEKGAS